MLQEGKGGGGGGERRSKERKSYSGYALAKKSVARVHTNLPANDEIIQFPRKMLHNGKMLYTSVGFRPQPTTKPTT